MNREPMPKLLPGVFVLTSMLLLSGVARMAMADDADDADGNDADAAGELNPGTVFELLRKAAESGPADAAGVVRDMLTVTNGGDSVPPVERTNMARVIVAILQDAGTLDGVFELLERDARPSGDADRELQSLEVLASLWEARGETDRAVELYRRILEQREDDPHAHAALAQYYFTRQEYADMIRSLDVVWKKAPSLLLVQGWRTGEYYRAAHRVDALITRIAELKDNPALERYGQQLEQLAQAMYSSPDGQASATAVYQAILEVLPFRFRPSVAVEYGFLLQREQRQQDAYNAFKLGFFPAKDSQTAAGYTVFEHESNREYLSGDVRSPMIALADLAAEMQALDRLESETRVAINVTPEWEPTGELLLAMLNRRRGDEQPLADLGARCLEDEEYAAARTAVLEVLRQELSRCSGSGPLRTALELWRQEESAAPVDDRFTGEPRTSEDASPRPSLASLHQQALIEWKLEEPEEARQLWLQSMDRLDEQQPAIEQRLAWQGFVGEQFQRHGFLTEALQVYRQVLQDEEGAKLPEGSYGGYMIEQTQRRLSDLAESLGNDQAASAVEADEIVTSLLALLFPQGPENDPVLAGGAGETYGRNVAQAVVALAKSTGRLAELRKEWEAHPHADSVNMLALTTEAAMAGGDVDTARRLLDVLGAAEERTGTSAPLWSAACLLRGLEPTLKVEYRETFQGDRLNTVAFRYQPNTSRDFVHPGRQGLRTTNLPAGDDHKNEGVAFKSPVHGNFDISVSFEVLAVEGTAQYGSLRVWTKGNQDAAFFSVNGLSEAEGGRYTTNHGRMIQGRRNFRTQTHAGNTRAGTFRLLRKGTTLFFLVADEPGGAFRRLYQVEFGDDDLVGMRLSSGTIEEVGGIDVRWSNLVIRAEAIPGVPTTAPSPTPSGPPSAGLIARVDEPAPPDLKTPSDLATPPAATGPLNLDHLVAEYHHDFRDGAFDDENLELINGSDHVDVDSNGLQFHLAGGTEDSAWAAIEPKFKVQGDFEITAAYEILEMVPPKAGNGTRLQVRAALDSPENEALMCAVAMLPSGELARSAIRTRIVDDKPQLESQRFLTTARSGRLRLVRLGRVLHFFVADGDGADFQELHRLECGEEPVGKLRIAASLQDANSKLKLDLSDLTIRAEELPGWTGPPPATSRRLVFWIVGCAIVAVFLVAGIWWVRVLRA